ncbi:hypothetical protein HH310_41665 [Actinoplanes sp. TBRC 11911]|uniref:hypothetical protein n=1 Tax=Actinoplanes sp. TBRC 11911 TaxID=2729386 RepID=UPI00145E41FC|nr:hypothetical protein [Actinoplanes sp. TBRC 11911]NMO57662.1 hypothetical protein [Actinoplanes sp. TBRC 11911]
MKARASEGGAPGRREAVHGVEQRLAATLQAYPGLRLDPIPAQFLRQPEAAEPSGPKVRAGAYPGAGAGRPDETPGLTVPSAVASFFGGGGHRVLRGGHLRDLGGEAAGEAYGLIRELWESSGCPVDDVSGLDGRVLIVHDPAGYLITVTGQGEEDPILTVASPPVASQFLERGLVAGVLSGLTIGCVGPCVAGVGPLTMFPAMVGLNGAYWGWVPLFLLVVGVTLWRPETRRFGVGLLVGGALVGFTVAGIVSSA